MTSFGKYEVLEVIGEGGFGRVFRGYDPVLRRAVAIKTCTLREPDMAERFAREAEIAANLRHPNIVTVYDFGVHEGEPYLVQEYLEGEDLDSKIKREDGLELAKALDWLRQIAEGLFFAHGRGVIHRDVKPGNVRVLPDGQIRIMDFGIAKLLQSERQLTHSGFSLGTVGYLAPEQLQGQDIDHRVDIFSFGVMAYELMARRKPFEGDTITAVLYRIAHEEPPPLRTLAPDCPLRLVRLIERCLRKEREARFASFLPVIDELSAITRELGGVAPAQAAMPSGIGVAQPASVATERLPPERPKRRLSPAAWGLISATLAVAVFGIINLSELGHTATVNRNATIDTAGDSLKVNTGGEGLPVDTSPSPSSDSGGPDTTASSIDTSLGGRAPDSTPIDTGRGPRGGGIVEKPPVKDSIARPPISGTRVLLLVRSDLSVAAESAESALIAELLNAGYQVVDAASLGEVRQDPGFAEGQANSISRIGRAAGAGSVLLIDASAEARPLAAGLFSGSSAVNLKLYPTSTGLVEVSERFEIGTSQIPGELGPTAPAAASAAVKAAGFRAARFVLPVLERLR